MKNRPLTLGLCLVLLLPACNKDSLNKVNPNGSKPDLFYSNAVELVQGVNGIYALIQGNNLVGREYFFTHDLRSDEFATGGGGLEAPRAQLLNGTMTPSNAVMNSVWNGFYRTVLRANAVIENAPKAQGVSDELRKRSIGEAQFLRAWAYYNLVSLWGPVPLYKETSKALGDVQARASEADVYKSIVEDLNAAQANLLPAYSGADKGRATKGAALSLLGKVYMQQGNYTAAKTELDKVLKLAVDNSIYKLEANYEDNFKEETGFNGESIFEIGYSGTTLNWDSGDGDGAHDATTRTQEYSAIGWRNVIPSDALLGEYERVAKGDLKNDPRLAYTFYRIGDKINGGTITLAADNPTKDEKIIAIAGTEATFEGKKEKISWKKYTSLYKNKETFYLGPMNMRVIRYADVLLLLAECENEVGDPAKAIAYMNEVRGRASVDMPDYPTVNYPVNNKAEIFKAIMHERRVELAGEQVRSFDIARWRKQNKLAAEPITYFQKGKHELLPIPQDELSNNPKLTSKDQNPGY